MTVKERSDKVTSVTKPAWGGSVESVIQGRLEDCLLYSPAVHWNSNPLSDTFFFFITVGKRVAYYQIRTGVECRVGKKGEGT